MHFGPLRGPLPQHEPEPDLAPIELWGLTYAQAVEGAKTGMAMRRPHWCAPVVVWNGRKLVLDDDGEIGPWRSTVSDRKAADWNVCPRET